MLEELYLSELEESECENIINSLHTHNQKLDYLLWRLKFEIFADGTKQSRKFGSFRQICMTLHEDYDSFPAPSTCHERAYAYEEKRILTEEMLFDISNIKLSVTALLELRKATDLENKRRIFEMALNICRNNRVTAEDIENAYKMVGLELGEPEKLLLSQSMHQTTQSPGEITDYLYVDGARGNYEGEEITDLKNVTPNREVLEFTLLDGTSIANGITASQESMVHNQGIQFYPNSRIYLWQGMRFRSKAEIAIAHALDQFSAFYLPNCLARLNDPQKPQGRANKEADFLVCFQGQWGILEVDGPHHTPDRRVAERERERLFRLHGIRVVERYDSTRCEEQPFGVLREFLQLLRQ
jgi:hypothetical protein